MTLSEVVARLSGAKSSGPNDQFVAQCPVHNDRTASLSVGIGTDGRVLLHCHAGCSTDSILSALGLDVGDLFPDQTVIPVQTPARPVIRAVSSPIYYDYTDADGTVVHQVVRGADKSFRQRHRNGTGAWVWKSSGIRVPYRLSDLMASQSKTVWVCEGEKDVDACWNLGLSATTNLGGAGKWTQAETDALVKAGITTGYVIPDNDIPGRTHAESVIASLTQSQITGTLVTLNGLKPHGDLSDWLTDPTHDRAALERCAQHAGALALQSPEATPPLSGRLESHHPSPPDLLTASSEFVRLSEGRYTLTYPDLGIVFDVSRLRLERQRDLHGQLTVRTTMQGAKTVDGVLSSSSFNLSSQQSRTRLATFLGTRSGAPGIDWLSGLEALCWKVTQAFDAGTPVETLSEVPLPPPDSVWNVAGLTFPQTEPSFLYGDGGTGKSYLALWIATILCRDRGINVLYCDWEFSASEHRVRLERLCGPDHLPGGALQYMRCVSPLVQEQQKIEQVISEKNIGFCVMDSVTFANDGAPESAEFCASYFRATRSLGVGSLHLAHTTKQTQDGQDSKPFGSTFWHNGARATYLVKRAESGPNNALVEVSITNKKSNSGPLLPPVGVRLTFTENRTEIDPFDVAQSPDLSSSLPIWQRVKSLVATGPGLTVKELAEELCVPPGSVAKAVSRMDMFSKDHQQRVRLVNSNEIIL